MAKQAPKNSDAPKEPPKHQYKTRPPPKNRPHATRRFPGGNLVLGLKPTNQKTQKQTASMCKELAGDVFKKLNE